MRVKFMKNINSRGFFVSGNRRVLRDVGIVDSRIVRAQLEIKCARLPDESLNFVFQETKFEIKRKKKLSSFFFQ